MNWPIFNTPQEVLVGQEALKSLRPAVMANLSGIIRDGLQVRSGDRCVSWLPFYHDMGLVGFVLGPYRFSIIG